MSKLLTMQPAGIPDAVARGQALDITRSWIVEAPAGSGKTGLLIQRYLGLLADPNVSEPEQVLTITFTKAATEEIRDRVIRELSRASEDADADTEYDRATRTLAMAVLLRDSELGWNLLDDPSRLRVRTIDAVCAEIARSLPVLCGGSGSLIPVEDPSMLYAEASRRTWMCLGGDDAALSDALRLLLLHRDGDLTACMALVADMLAQREQWESLARAQAEELEDDAVDSRVRHQLDRSLEQVICETLSGLVDAFPEPLLRRLTTLANSLSDRSGLNGKPSPLAVCRELKTAPSAAAEDLVYWRALFHLLVAPSKGSWRKQFTSRVIRAELTGQDISLLKEIALDIQQYPGLLDLLKDAAALPSPRFPSELWPLTQALCRVLRRALAELQQVFLEASKCDFAEPALLARYALSQESGPNDLQTALGTELRHLLVDEMQDTNGQQYELIERLTLGWQYEQKTVFLVGDPKQSIYLFRQARVERFNKTMRTGMLGQLPLQSLQLTANFRSQAELVKAFNQDFSRIFPQSSRRADDVIYVQADPVRQGSPQLPVTSSRSWHLSVADGGRPAAQQTHRQQTRHNAREIRRIIEMWQDRPLPRGRTAPWKIAVLVKTRSSLGPVIEELRRSPAIQVNALKIETLYERPEILDLLALTRALLHAADRTAWLAVLHAPWCGLGLADLHALTGSDDPGHLSRTMMSLMSLHGTELTPDGSLRLERVWAALDMGVRSAGRLRLPERVERTWRSLGGHTYLEEFALQNANTFLELLQTLDQEEGEVVDRTLLRRLKSLHASSDSRPGAVDLATIHGAKGLEWDLVLVPELERRSAIDSSRLFEWEELPSNGVILAPISGKGEDALELTRWLRRVRSKREAAERKRLFYVACTRAREELHLFGIASQASDGVRASPRSLLEASWDAAEPHLAETADTSNSDTTERQVMASLAAASEESAADEHRPMLERLPLAAMRVSNEGLLKPPANAENENSNQRAVLRPHGSFVARSIGTAVHLFLEEAANKLATGLQPEQLVKILPSWEPRIRAVLRGDGLPPLRIGLAARTVLQALQTSLSDPLGRWLLEGKLVGQSELAIVTNGPQILNYRVDRVFRGGAEPGVEGSEYLWIIDYKTSAFTGDRTNPVTLQSFLTNERQRFEPQLQTYAGLFQATRIRLGLWYPLLGELTWWSADSEGSSRTKDVTNSQLLLF